MVIVNWRTKKMNAEEYNLYDSTILCAYKQSNNMFSPLLGAPYVVTTTSAKLHSKRSDR